LYTRIASGSEPDKSIVVLTQIKDPVQYAIAFLYLIEFDFPGLTETRGIESQYQKDNQYSFFQQDNHCVGAYRHYKILKLQFTTINERNQAWRLISSQYAQGIRPAGGASDVQRQT
jgi:hypothetical protein